MLAICLGAPIAEVFDSWDDTVHDGYDTEANLVVAVLCVGVAMSFARSIVESIRNASSRSDERSVCVLDRASVRRVVLAWTIPSASPPTPLRI